MKMKGVFRDWISRWNSSYPSRKKCTNMSI